MQSLRARCWRIVATAAVIMCASRVGIRAQEMTPQGRLSGAWQINPAMSSPIPEPGARSDSQGNKWGGAGGTGREASQTGQPMLSGGKAILQLMEDLSEVPRHMAITATSDAINLIDDHGLSRRFAPINKSEKIDYGSGKPSFRTHWDGAILLQEINSDAIDMTRTFETTPDGSRLTVTLFIRRQPDPQAMAAMGNRGETRKYVYDRVS